MFIVAAANIFGFLSWLLTFLFPGDRLTFIQNHLRHYDRLKTPLDKEMSKSFTHEYLKQDGVFLLRLISHNTNAVTTTEITCLLWDLWKERPKQKQLLAMDAYMDDSDQETMDSDK